MNHRGIRRIHAMAGRVFAAACAMAALVLGVVTPAAALNDPVAGQAFFAANCQLAGCHSGGPLSPYTAPRNGGGAALVILTAMQNGMVADPGAAIRSDLAAYLNVFVNYSLPNNAPVPYNAGGASPTAIATQIVVNSTYAGITGMATVGVGPTKGTVSYDSAGQILYTPNVGAFGADSWQYQGTNGNGRNTTVRNASVMIGNPPAPVVNSSTTANGQSGVAFSYQITATNFPTGFGASPLPAGWTVSPTGLIQGTPAAPGTINLTLSATNAGGTGNGPLAITVTLGPPVITSSGTANGNVGVAFNYQIVALNSPTSYGISDPPLPAGLTLDTSTGAITGIPATNGSFSRTLTATNGTGTGSKVVNFVIGVGVPAITSANTASGQTGVAFSYQITATNGPPFTGFTASALPAGLTFNTSSGLISGIPTAVGGPTNVTLTASNSTGPSANFNLAITIGLGPPVITSPNTAAGGVTVPFSYQITATNPPHSAFGATGLPTGLTIDTATGLISGTPAPGTAGTHSVTLSVTNATATGTLALTLTVSQSAPVITSGSTAAGQTGVAFSYQITASNGPTAFNATGLPAGLSVNTGTGLISGTPGAVGTFNVTISAGNGAGTGNQAVTLTVILGPPVITSAATAGGVADQPFSYQITATNSPSSFGATGLPPGLSVNATTGLISGTPLANGTFSATITATNSTATASRALTIVINTGIPVITSAATAAADTATPFAYRIVAANSPTAYGANGLPPGLSLNASSGLIAGTPTAAGIFNVSLAATNATGTGTAVLRLTVTLAAPGTVGGGNAAASGQAGQGFQYQVQASGNPTGFTATGLPQGLAIDPSSGLIFGVPTRGGTFVVQVTATNAAGSTTFTLTLTIGFAIATVGDATVNVAFQQATAITLPVAGDVGTVTILTMPDHGIVATGAGGVVVTYTPATGYSGSDRFTYSVTNPAGTSTEATVTITVGTFAPVGLAATMVVPINTPTTLDLARFITASGLTGVTIVEDAKKGFVAVNGTKVIYTPAADYFGPDSFTYIAFGNAGKSQPARVTISIQGRPDPTKDPAVGAIAEAQALAARRFAAAQVDNVQRRMESLHRAPARPAAPRVAGETDSPPTPLVAERPQRVDVAGVLSPGMIASLVTAAASRSLDVGASAEAREAGGTSLWVAGTAQFGQRDASDAQGGFRFSTDGITVGADRRFSDSMALGIAAGFARDESGIGSGGSSKARGASISVYGSWSPVGGLFVDALAGLSRLDFDSSRWVPAMDDFARADRRGSQAFASVAVGYELQRESVQVSPYGRFDVTRDRLDRVSESGAGPYALTFNEQSTTSSRVALGVRAESRHATDFGFAIPRARIEYRRELQGDRTASVSYADLAGGPEYTLTPAGLSRNSLLLGVGADFLVRGGLKLGLDYQALRNGGLSNTQGVRLMVTQDLDARGMPSWSWDAPMFKNPVSVDAGFAYDDNVNREREKDERLSDRIASFSISQQRAFSLGKNTRLLVTGTASGEKFHTYQGLGRFSAGVQGDLQYRASGAFDATTWSLVGRAAYDEFESRLRSGGKYFAAVNARRSITDRIDLFGELGYHARNGHSEVFNTREAAAKVNIDYSLGKRGILYLSGEYRKGDLVSTGGASLANLAIAEVLVPDDAFDGLDLFAYRLEGKTVLGTLGWNYPLGPRDAIDFSWRRVQGMPDARPPFASPGPWRYINNQYSIVYLMRF